MQRVFRFLRSRRLASVLIAVVIAYSAAATLLPLGPPQDPDVIEWAREHPRLEAFVGPLGLHQPFSSPPFIVVAILLIGSTAICSWERTVQATAMTRIARAPGVPSLSRRPSFTVGHVGEPLQQARAALEALGMHVRADEAGIVASKHLWGGAGSPLFHWSLVGLFLLAGAGQLTRSEGIIAVVQGERVRDERASYLTGLQTGAMFGERFTQLDFEVTGIEMGLVVGGVGRGDSPRVSVLRDDSVVVADVVYPNHPIRFGSVVVHRGELGPAAGIELTLPDGTVQRRAVALVDGDPAAPYGGLNVRAQGSQTGDTLMLQSVPGQRLVVRVPERGHESEPIRPGESVQLPGDIKVKLLETTVFARLIVVNDWSVPFIYALFALAALGELAALFFPPRVVVVRRDAAAARLDVWVLRKKLDPAFPAAVETRLRQALGDVTGVEPQ